MASHEKDTLEVIIIFIRFFEQMKLTLKLPSLLPPASTSSPNKTITDVTKKETEGNGKENIYIENTDDLQKGRSLRPRKQVVYNQKLHRRSERKSTPVKTADVSILPLPLGELKERQELEEQLRHLESIEMETLIHTKSSTSEDGVRYVMYKGRMIREGDYVAVRGHDEKVYYAVVYDVCLGGKTDESGWPDRLFRLRWLLPKMECSDIVMGNPQKILPEHFHFGPMHDGFESVENIVGVFYSPSEIPFATRWVSKYTKNLRPAPVLIIERREGLRRNKNVEKSSGSKMMQDLEAAHLLFELQRQV